jgi:hypothetical protein
MQHAARQRKETGLDFRDLQARCKPLQRSIITRDEVRHPRLLEWFYCNRTATGLIHASTQRTQDWFWHTENPLNKRYFRTHQYGLACTQANS